MTVHQTKPRRCRKTYHELNYPPRSLFRSTRLQMAADPAILGRARTAPPTPRGLPAPSTQVAMPAPGLCCLAPVTTPPAETGPAHACAKRGCRADLIGAGVGNVDDSCRLLGLQIGDEGRLEGLGLAHDVLLVTATGQSQQQTVIRLHLGQKCSRQ